MGDLDLAMRIILSRYFDVAPYEVDRAKQILRCRQAADGSWRKDSMYRTVRSRLHFGAESLTTAFAVRALAGDEKWPERFGASSRQKS